MDEIERFQAEIKIYRKEIAKRDDEIRILKLRLETAKKMFDDISEISRRMN